MDFDIPCFISFCAICCVVVEVWLRCGKEKTGTTFVVPVLVLFSACQVSPNNFSDFLVGVALFHYATRPLQVCLPETGTRCPQLRQIASSLKPRACISFSEITHGANLPLFHSSGVPLSERFLFVAVLCMCYNPFGVANLASCYAMLCNGGSSLLNVEPLPNVLSAANPAHP